MTQPREGSRDLSQVRRISPRPPIVVGVDGCAAGRITLAAAGRLAERVAATLIVAVVHQSFNAGSVTGQPLADLRQDLELQVVTDATQVLEPLNVCWQFTVAVGEPAGALRQIAEEYDAALIVVGTRGPGLRARLHRLTEGSTSARLAHDSSRPVLVVPSP